MNFEEMKAAVETSVNAHADSYTQASDTIWDLAEVNFHEDKSAAVLRAMLEGSGFEVTDNLAGLPNAFKGVYGSGRPVIGFLGEFDALSAMSQKPGCAKKEALVPGRPGHGCGHNLLGVGALGAAIAVKEMIERGELSGTVVYFGCPAEETGSAKAFMARDGVFDGFDAFLTWHPWDYNGIWPGSSLANVKLIFRFYGQASHAAGSPHLGRSALDACELMNVGVQFLREHVPEDTRMHYAITDAGGASPNVVQAYSEVVYLVRSPRLPDLEDIKNRVIDCAKGAALMTGTRVEIEFVKGCSNVLPNHTIGSLLHRCLTEYGAPEYTQDELALAAALHDSLEAPQHTLDIITRVCDDEAREAYMKHDGDPIYAFIAPHARVETPNSLSTDVGDASWQAPTSQLHAASWAANTPAHSWQAVSIGKSGVAHKAELLAAKSLALAACVLFSDKKTLDAAQAEFARRTKAQPYVCPIPAGISPKY